MLSNGKSVYFAGPYFFTLPVDKEGEDMLI